MKPFFVTTPIYYVNDRPHIGHAYSTVAVDVFARHARLRGRPTRFLTGLDEHGLKIERRATEVGMTPQAFVDSMVPPFQEAWVDLGCANDDFIRTTEARHKAGARALWTRLEASSDVYLGDYEDWYCVGCEAFKTEKDLLPGNICPDHKKPVERIKEQSFFFRLSRYTEPLLAFYEANPGFVQPSGRFNEVKAFVAEGLRDLSISRTSFSWGIPVPGHDQHVMYVWLDALANYLSALGGPAEAGAAPLYDQFWGGDAERVHVVGKDILRFHAIFWPAFLMAAGLPLPTRIEAHGWLTVNGEKMSKGLGNFLPPRPLCEAFGADVLRYYLMREIGFGQDGDFSHANLVARYNGELANGLGNLLNRIVASLVRTQFDAKVPARAALTEIDEALVAVAERVAREASEHLSSGAPHRALDAIFELVAAANRYVDQTAPWALAKQGDKERLGTVCYLVLESLRWLSVLLAPFMPSKCAELRAQIGLPPLAPEVGVDLWPSRFGELVPGLDTQVGSPLFPRIDKDREAAIRAELGLVATAAPGEGKKPEPKKAEPKKPSEPKPELATQPAQTAADAPADTGLITIDDLVKVKLRLATVLAAERVPKSDKLLKLSVDAGDGAPRQILAGIGQHYEPDALVGKQLVVVANLPPRKMMGLESNGMVLAASDASGLSVLFVDKPITPGSAVK